MLIILESFSNSILKLQLIFLCFFKVSNTVFAISGDSNLKSAPVLSSLNVFSNGTPFAFKNTQVDAAFLPLKIGDSCNSETFTVFSPFFCFIYI